jgi:hypothetical protein
MRQNRTRQIANMVLLLAVIAVGIGWERANRAGQPPPAWAQILLYPVVVLGYLLTQTELAQGCGWTALAARYRARSRPKGRSLLGQVTRIGKMNEGNITRLIVTDEGLFLHAIIFCRFGRPPLLIPWRDIGWVQEAKEIFFTVWDLDLGGITSIRIRRKAYERLKDFVPVPGTRPPRPLAGGPPPPIE